jgi:SAM-dependent methyltransferase/uncharacterized protein (DUF2062 family)
MRRRIHALWQQLVNEHTAPARLGAAVFVGCVVGCTPLFGLHFFVCVALALAFGLNKLVVYGAANLSIPPMVPLLGFASVQLGERIRHGKWLALRRADFAWHNIRVVAKAFFIDWTVGGVALGATIGLVAGGATWMILRRRGRAVDARSADTGAVGQRATDARPADRVAGLVDRARHCYDGLHPRFKWYARMKYVMDPVYCAIAQQVPAGAFVVDLGTGLGMLPVLLGLQGDGRRVLGIEWDAAKVACGVHASRQLDGIEIVAGDARCYTLPECDVVTLVDMLHYWDADAQRALLERCRRALRPGGRILIREGDPARRGGARLTRAVEWLATKLGWNLRPAVRFRPVAELRADLEALGFAVSVDDVAARTHPGNVLLVGALAD